MLGRAAGTGVMGPSVLGWSAGVGVTPVCQAPAFQARRQICSHSWGPIQGTLESAPGLRAPGPASLGGAGGLGFCSGGICPVSTLTLVGGNEVGKQTAVPRPGLERKGGQRGGGGASKYPGSQCSLWCGRRGQEPVGRQCRAGCQLPWGPQALARGHPRLCPHILFALEPEARFIPECPVRLCTKDQTHQLPDNGQSSYRLCPLSSTAVIHLLMDGRVLDFPAGGEAP